MRKLTKREIILLTLLILGGLGFSFYKLYYQPVIAEIAGLQQELELEQNKLMVLQKLDGEITPLEESLEKSQTEIKEKQDTVFKEEYNQVLVISELQDMIDDLGATEKLVGYSEPTQEYFVQENPTVGTYNITSISLSFVCEEKQMKEIIKALQMKYGLNCIEMLSMAVQTAENLMDEEGNPIIQPNKLSVSMNLNLYTNGAEMQKTIKNSMDSQFTYSSDGLFK